MANRLDFIPRNEIDSAAWDACVAASAQQVVYGYSWYLDAVLPAPNWKWIGLIQTDERGNYLAIMPVPLRRKLLLGIHYSWVVHQPFFCQFLAVFSADKAIDTEPFLLAVQQRFRYASTFRIYQPIGLEMFTSVGTVRQLTTHILDLSVGYERLVADYSRDRKLNLRRAEAANWSIFESTDLEPVLTLFCENHAGNIDGGVAEWAYDMLTNLAEELRKRGFVSLRYATRAGNIEAGALFVQEGNRIIYLFNAASELGRKGNARTLLIDQIIQKYTGHSILFDFESPEKSSIVDFYRSFGAVEESFLDMRWNRLSLLERGLLRFKNHWQILINHRGTENTEI